jgi:multisubunit Na+/H+ antiporter MnhC subunit
LLPHKLQSCAILINLSAYTKPMKWIITNIVVSVGMFFFIFKSYAGVSGGDIAIVMFNIFFGLFQIAAVAIIAWIYKKSAGKMLLAIVICQAAELLFFIQLGYELNSILRH